MAAGPIWCLFSERNNLVCWWPDEPGIQELARVLGVPDMKNDEEFIAVVRIHKGMEHRFINTDYRLQQVQMGTVL